MIPFPGAFSLSPMAVAIQSLYNMGEAVNDFLDRHIASMKASDNPAIETTGRILEAVKFGFSLGYVGSIAIIAAGQLLLGNSLASAALAAGKVATFSNPIAMTCASVGAICYGWGALSEKERSAILTRLTDGLQMGYELIKSIIDFVIRKAGEFLSSKQLTEFKAFIKTQASLFGKTLYDITRTMGDWAKGAVEKVEGVAGQAADGVAIVSRKAVSAAGEVAVRVADSASEAAELVSSGAISASIAIAETASSFTEKVEEGAKRAASAAAESALAAKEGLVDVLDRNGDGRVDWKDVTFRKPRD